MTDIFVRWAVASLCERGANVAQIGTPGLGAGALRLGQNGERSLCGIDPRSSSLFVVLLTATRAVG
ncbi:MAG: hypothetical protein MUC50_18070 [Myxococcota bacterium]|nr:hypothetical protein [Myxococcota bacterium]